MGITESHVRIQFYFILFLKNVWFILDYKYAQKKQLKSKVIIYPIHTQQEYIFLLSLTIHW
jgi:hypothetical protein